MIYDNSRNIKGVEAKFRVLNTLCKENKYERHPMCNENISDIFGKITVSRSINFVYATGPDQVEGNNDDLIWFEGVIYAPATPTYFEQYVGAGGVFYLVFLLFLFAICFVLFTMWRSGHKDTHL